MLRDAEYWDYKNFTIIDWGMEADYEIGLKIGYGEYSKVYSAVNIIDNTKCVVKILNRIKSSRVRREIKILQNLYGGENVIKLLDVVLNLQTNATSLVFDHVDNTNYKILYPTLTDYDTRYYMFELLKALDFSHSNGIMHRDVKPLNVMIDHKKRELRLIDWGLADFYHPGRKYNVEVASLYYQSPELLVEFEEYDYALDLWSFGCIFSSIIFQKLPFFKGANDNDQLVKISQVLGTDGLFQFLGKYNMTLKPRFDNILGRYQRKPWFRFITPSNEHLVSDDALDLVDKLLRYDHQDRLTAKEAQAHPYFAAIREAEARKQSTLSSLIEETVSGHGGDGDSFLTHSHSSSSGDPLGGSDDVIVSSTYSGPSKPFIGLDTMPSSAPTSAASTQATLIPAPAHAHANAEHLIQLKSCPLGSPVYSLTTANDVTNSVKHGVSTDVSIIILSLVGPVLLRLLVLFTCYFYDRIYNDEKKKDFFSF